jgi:hydrocephalus-inducing protein
VSLVGDSSLVTYSISIPLGLIDCGEVKYCEWVSKEFFITNTGKVTFEYKVSLHTVKKKGFVDVQPMSGRIAGGDK